jgi:hypothetical protein
VLTANEATVLASMAEKDAREMFVLLQRIRRAMPGTKLRGRRWRTSASSAWNYVGDGIDENFFWFGGDA